jgi:hypothetical protein
MKVMAGSESAAAASQNSHRLMKSYKKQETNVLLLQILRIQRNLNWLGTLLLSSDPKGKSSLLKSITSNHLKTF